MRYVLGKEAVSTHERNILARYRSIHFITPNDHTQCLASLGWHPLVRRWCWSASNDAFA